MARLRRGHPPLSIALLIATAVLTGAGFAGALLFEPALGNVSGRLVARDSGRPVPAEVSISGMAIGTPRAEQPSFSTRGDAKGRFSFSGIPAGVYHLEASSPGHAVEGSVVYVEEGKTTPVELEMRRRPSWVQLLVHRGIVHPDEPVSAAVRGLTMMPSYRFDVYRVSRWRRVTAQEALEYVKAFNAALAAGDIAPVFSRQITPRHIDREGVFYDRPVLGRFPVGQYVVVATGETGCRSAAAITVSRLALLVKSDAEQALAYVADLKSGDPIAGARVSAGHASAVTDARGLARLSLRGVSGEDITYRARAGDDIISVDTWRYESAPEPYRLYAFTDRPIYRPGDRVRFKGVLRKIEFPKPTSSAIALATAELSGPTSYRLPGRIPLDFTVTDEDGVEIYKARLTTNDQGSFAGEFTLPKLAKAGNYPMTASIGTFRDTTFVTVASYLKPELQLSARPMKPQYVRGERAEVEVQATYYFGAPAADLDLRWSLFRSIHYPSTGLEDEYEYGGDEYGDYGGEMVSEGEGKTDAAGRLRLTPPSALPGGKQGEEENPYCDHVFQLQVWSTSEAGGSAETHTRYLVTRGRFSLMLSPDRYLLTPKEPAAVKVVTRDFAGHPVANQEITLALVTESTPRRRGPGRAGVPPASEVQRRTLTRWKARTGKDGVATTSVTVPKSGGFILEAVARDAEQHTIATREHLWAAGGGYWDFGEGQGDISIVSDRKQYHAGDHVKLLVTSQRDGQALFCLEGRRLYEVRTISLHRGANMVEFDLQPEYLPSVYAWIGQVYDKQLHQAEVEVLISLESKRLTVKVQPAKPDYRPGQTATCAVQVTDSQGRPVQAEVAIGVVDEAIYALAEDALEDAADYFYAHDYNHVRTDFAPESYYLGGDGKAPTNVEVRRRFEDTAYWSPQVMTDGAGRAQVSFKLPDNLTSWRATVRAVSADTRGGTGKANFRVNKPLMVRLDLPRFATEGDRFRVSAYFHNETDTPQQVAAKSWARGLKLESRDGTLTIPARGVIREDWWATVISSNDAVIGASAVVGRGPGAPRGAALQDAVELTLPVNPLTRTQFDAWSGRTERSVDCILPIRDDAVPDLTRLTVGVSPSVAASLFSNLDYLAQYPYGCVEQTISSFLPDLYVLELLRARGMGDSSLAKRIPPMLVEGLARLSGLQREEGGWGWGRWGELDIWMTSYALLALQEAKQEGYHTVGIGRALPHLEEALRVPRYEYPDDLAFAAYVLVRVKSELAVSTLAKALHDRELSGRGRALCVLALFELGNDLEAHQLMNELWDTARHEGELTYWSGLQDEQCRWWDGGANVEATAWALKAALRADAKDPRAASVAGWLLQTRRGDHWVSTRDTAIALSALVDYLRSLDEPNPDYTAVVKLNGKEILRHTFSPDLKTWQEVTFEVPAAELHRGGNQLTFSRGTGSGRLYYRANLHQQVRMTEQTKAATGDVFQITREYFKLARGRSAGQLAYGPGSRPEDTFAADDRVLVRLTINSAQRLRYVLIEDPLPAGLEPNARGDAGFMDWRSWWVDNDVRDDRVNFYLDWLPVGGHTIEYVVTARTLGRFHAPPPSGFAMYQPTINAVGDQAILEVKP